MKVLVLFFSAIPLGLCVPSVCADLSREPYVHQVIISEIMADPDPAVMLPGYEYIELFNRSGSVVDLEGWQLSMGKHTRLLTRAVMAPDDYLIICKSGSEGAFQCFGKTLAVPAMPAVVNTGQTLTLKSPSGKTVHTVSFSPEWYASSTKANGGWSLEIIDPDNPCGQAENWSASVDPRGGTPCSRNSVDAENPDSQAPRLLRATLPSDSTVLLLFNESMNLAAMLSPGLYSANGGLLHPACVNPVEPDNQAVLLCYPRRFDPAARYTLTVLQTLQDCAGNRISDHTSVEFALPVAVSPFDIIINEILFDPLTDNAEFIELYNRSTKVLDLSELSISLTNPVTEEVKAVVPLHDHPFLLFPGRFAVITRRARSLPNGCFINNPGVILEAGNLFALPDEEGRIAITDSLARTIDAFHYTRNLHAGLLKQVTGVSLERTDCDTPTDSPENWHSASTAAGYATPGIRNSQSLPQDDRFAEIIVQPAVFSPDDDGMDDTMTLRMRLTEPGKWANIMVLDAFGNRIRDIALRYLLGTEEYFTWDGTTNDHGRADIGIYLIHIEIMSKKGNVNNIIKVVTLSRKI